jgi:aminopeptidase
MLETETFPLVRALHAAVIHAGAYPYMEFQSTYLERDLLDLGNDEQISWISEMARSGMEWADVYIGVRGSSDPALLEGIDRSKISAHRKAMGVVSTLRTEQTRWVLVRVPGPALAYTAGIDERDLMELFFKSSLLNWREETVRYQSIQALFNGAEYIRLIAPGTDLSLETAGRTFVTEDGHINMPGGELYTSPVEDSADGTIRFSYPGVFAGQPVAGIELEFSRGVAIAARAESNQELLANLLEMDRGARRIGELGMGLNRALDRYCCDPLYDEKILGTVHLALGRSYTHCGGQNQSALHWDLVTDFRQKGEIYVDGRRVFSKGEYLI